MSTATKQCSPERGFTGWHMVAVMSLFFGTIISVNLVMAWNASRSWSGLVVENTYIASQQFNGKVAEGRAFQASGIKGRLTAGRDAVRYVLTRNGEPERQIDKVIAVFKRPVEEHEDLRVELHPRGEGVFVLGEELRAGQWIAAMTAMEGDAVVHRHTVRFIAEGRDK
ncbi:cation transporter [Sinorhizobium medicae]|uniref:FixH family protein n=2 Tax=Sinorhizobium medicae TaxID=110321 RepID=A6ULU2_SINMW|nr:FixH family protein [Sinorhizobium medicae]PND20474.1 cation transporter [Ensifer sp. MMN_5]ABR64622.1 FixH family protein [Sinorhizobium medicae WSM419]MDX0407987.1 cation transporter [Sinorhizobium medicae]MDX0413764.1 cation transporter [Sinorhizobium medicae]MDX0419917.1 cation transporter [Sinorhizobium medicae]